MTRNKETCEKCGKTKDEFDMCDKKIVADYKPVRSYREKGADLI